jgi:hypothetical protein
MNEQEIETLLKLLEKAMEHGLLRVGNDTHGYGPVSIAHRSFPGEDQKFVVIQIEPSEGQMVEIHDRGE